MWRHKNSRDHSSNGCLRFAIHALNAKDTFQTYNDYASVFCLLRTFSSCLVSTVMWRHILFSGLLMWTKNLFTHINTPCSYVVILPSRMCYPWTRLSKMKIPAWLYVNVWRKIHHLTFEVCSRDKALQYIIRICMCITYMHTFGGTVFDVIEHIIVCSLVHTYVQVYMYIRRHICTQSKYVFIGDRSCRQYMPQGSKSLRY